MVPGTAAFGLGMGFGCGDGGFGVGPGIGFGLGVGSVGPGLGFVGSGFGLGLVVFISNAFAREMPSNRARLSRKNQKRKDHDARRSDTSDTCARWHRFRT